MVLSYEELLSILDQDNEKFVWLGEELLEVDDHGDSTKCVYFKDQAGTNYGCSFFVEKEWGILEQEKYGCFEVKKVLVEKWVPIKD